MITDLSSFDTKGLQAILVDSFLQKETPLTTGTKNSYAFSISNNSTSYNNRLFVRFSSIPLPISNFTIKGEVLKNNAYQIWWNYSNVAITFYLIEYSIDGINYSVIDTVKADEKICKWQSNTRQNSQLSKNCFYRIMALCADGKRMYSNVLQVGVLNIASKSLKLYPNPIKKGNTLLIDLKDILKGSIDVTISDVAGKTVFKKIVMGGNQSTLNIKLSRNIGTGIYFIQIKNDNQLLKSSFLIE